MKKIFKKENFLSVALSAVLSVFMVALVASAATTIDTNIQTDGTLSVTGTSALTGATTVTGLATLNGGASTTGITSTGWGYLASSAGSLVGIGSTSTPSNLLSVQGNSLISGNITSVANITATGTLTLSALGTSMLASINSSNALVPTSTPTAAYYLATSSSVASVLPYASTTQITSTNSAYLATGGGSVGVGTTTPSNLLSVQGNSLISGNITSVANITATGTLAVTGLATLNGGASTTALSASNSIVINGNATTSNGGNFSTNGTVTVGAVGSAINNIVYGYCTIAANSTITATTSAPSLACAATVTGGGTLSTSHEVFVQATTSLPVNFVILAASSTSGTNIAVQFANTGIISGTTLSSTPLSLNFFAIR